MVDLNPEEPIRVKDKDTGHEYSILRRSFDPDAHEELKGKDAADIGGTLLPATPNMDVGKIKSKPEPKQ